MKLFELANNEYHLNIRSWISKAKTLTIKHVEHVLHDESHRDSQWFISKRGSRLPQLVSEIFTLELKEVSNESWTEVDFEGHTHSDLITKAIQEIISAVEPLYHNIRVHLISQQLTQSKHIEQSKIVNPPTTDPEKVHYWDSINTST